MPFSFRSFSLYVSTFQKHVYCIFNRTLVSYPLSHTHSYIVVMRAKLILFFNKNYFTGLMLPFRPRIQVGTLPKYFNNNHCLSCLIFYSTINFFVVLTPPLEFDYIFHIFYKEIYYILCRSALQSVKKRLGT